MTDHSWNLTRKPAQLILFLWALFVLTFALAEQPAQCRPPLHPLCWQRLTLANRPAHSETAARSRFGHPAFPHNLLAGIETVAAPARRPRAGDLRHGNLLPPQSVRLYFQPSVELCTLLTPPAQLVQSLVCGGSSPRAPPA
jgi:hypothetical protein